MVRFSVSRPALVAVMTALLATPLVACGKTSPEAGPDASSSAPRSSATTLPSSADRAAAAASSGATSERPLTAKPPRPADRGNVLLLTIDSMRADMPWAGYPRDIAPNLAKLEGESVSYTRAYALSSYTSQSVGGFLAGDYPSTLARDGFFFGTYPKSVLLFPERLAAAGVRTVAAQAHGYFRHGTGLDQGFHVWKIVPGLKWNATTDENETGPAHEKLAEEILSDPTNVGGPFFAWFHFMDPHDLYKPHAATAELGKKPRDLYDGEIRATDEVIGKLLAFVATQPWASRTTIIVSSDHGESFGQHGVFRHGFELWEDLVRVPFFVRTPGAAPKRIDVPRSHLDLAPTVLDLLAVHPEPAFRGRSLLPEIRGTEPAEPRDVVVDLARTSDNDRRRGLVRGHHKLLAFGDDATFQLYDLATDPGEKNDVAKHDPERLKEMRDAYRALRLPEVKPSACRKLKGAPEGRDF